MDPNCPTFKKFFEIKNALSEEIAKTCEGVMSISECELTLKTMDNNKTPGMDGLTPELYHYFWNFLGSFMVSSFNFAFRNRALSISQCQGIISSIPKKNKNAEYLKNWQPVSLLNVDYKIATKTTALRLEKILLILIHHCQSGYVKRGFIGESIRLIADTMHFTKEKNRPFAGSGHVVQNKLHWDANDAVGLSKQRNSYQSSPTFLCFESPSASFASQCNLFCTM